MFQSGLWKIIYSLDKHILSYRQKQWHLEYTSRKNNILLALSAFVVHIANLFTDVHKLI